VALTCGSKPTQRRSWNLVIAATAAGRETIGETRERVTAHWRGPVFGNVLSVWSPRAASRPARSEHQQAPFRQGGADGEGLAPDQVADPVVRLPGRPRLADLEFPVARY
jgi:hypothetical protein